MRGAERVSGIIEGSARKNSDPPSEPRRRKPASILFPVAGALVLGVLAAVAVPLWTSIPTLQRPSGPDPAPPAMSPRPTSALSGEARRELNQAERRRNEGLASEGPDRVMAWSAAYESLRTATEHQPKSQRIWLSRLLQALWLALEPRGDRSHFLSEARTSEIGLEAADHTGNPLGWFLLWGAPGQIPSVEGAGTPSNAPPSGGVLWIQANWHLTKGNYQRAATDFQTLTSDPQFASAALVRWIEAATAMPHPPSLIGLTIVDPEIERAAEALLALASGDPDRARDFLGTLQTEDPPAGTLARPSTQGISYSREVPTLLAHVLAAWRTHRFAEASTLLDRASEGLLDSVEGPFPNALLASWIARARGRLAEADERAEAALAGAQAHVAAIPDDPWGYRNVALAHLSLGNRNEAATSIEEGLRLAEDRGDPRAMGKLKESKLMLLSPDTQEFQDLLNELLSAAYPWSLNPQSMEQDPRWSLSFP